MKTNGYKVFNHVRGTPEALDNIVRLVMKAHYSHLIYEMSVGDSIQLTNGLIETVARKSDACYQFIKHFHEHRITHTTWVKRKRFDEHMETYRTIEEL